MNKINIFYPVRDAHNEKSISLLRKGIVFVLFLHCISVLALIAQTNNNPSIEKRTYSIRLNTSDQHQALVELGRHIGYNFSYNAAILADKPVSVKIKDRDLDYILSEILGDSFNTYKIVGNQIVLTPLSDRGENKNKRISGTLYDLNTNEPVQFANIGIENSGYGTVSNVEGKFSLLIDSVNSNDTLVISALGYTEHRIPVQQVNQQNDQIIFLKNKYIPIREVVIRQLDPEKLVSRSIDRINDNYLTDALNLQSFYREYLQKDNTLRSLYEAYVTIYKPAFGSLASDQIKVQKAINFIDSTRRDTVSVKLKGGLSNISALDIARLEPYYYNKQTLGAYRYSIENIVHARNNDVYVVRFRPKEQYNVPPFKGRLYIEVNTLALVKIEVTLESNDYWDDIGVQIFRKTPRLKTNLRAHSFVVQYEKLGGKYYMKYFRSEIALRIRKKNNLFYSNYNITSELVSTRVDTSDTQKLSYKERINPETIFSDEIKNYPADFWTHYNTLPPEKDMLRDYFTE